MSEKKRAGQIFKCLGKIVTDKATHAHIYNRNRFDCDRHSEIQAAATDLVHCIDSLLYTEVVEWRSRRCKIDYHFHCHMFLSKVWLTTTLVFGNDG